MIYTCKCCGFQEAFPSPKEAFDAGWDVEPFFSIGPLCDYCPTTLYAKMIEIDGQTYLRELLPGETPEHQPVHDRWAREGRPTK